MAKIDKNVRKLLLSLEESKKNLNILKEKSEVEWKTNCVIYVDGESKNIKRSFELDLIKISKFIISESNSMEKIEKLFSMSDIQKEKYSLIANYSKEDWFHDLKKRWFFIEYNQQIKNINSKIEEAKNLLSNDEIRKMKLEELLD